MVTGGGNSALYARVSSADRKDDLERQLGRLAGYATGAGPVVTKTVTKTVTEIGSGMNAKRPELCRLLSDPTLTTLVVEHRYRPCRFGSEYLEAARAALAVARRPSTPAPEVS